MFTFFKCIIQCFLVVSQSCTTITIIYFQNSFITQNPNPILRIWQEYFNVSTQWTGYNFRCQEWDEAEWEGLAINRSSTTSFHINLVTNFCLTVEAQKV